MSLDERTRAWVASAVGDGARILRTERLVGGLTSEVRGVVVESTGGARHRFVLRQWMHAGRHEAACDVDNEMRVLERLRTVDVPAPRLIVADPTGVSTSGVPSLLMTRVPGHVQLRPRDPAGWLRQMARTLATLHAASTTGLHARVQETHQSVDERVGLWSVERARWRELARRASIAPAHNGTSGFVHGDFQHFNIVWSRGRLTGVVDWVSAGLGPIDYDVGHAELNLAVLFAPDWAHRFRQMYEAEAGRHVDPMWEARAVLEYGPNWPRFIPRQVGGRVPVDTEGMHARVDALAIDVLDRMSIMG